MAEYTPAQRDWLSPVKTMVRENIIMLGVMYSAQESFSVCRKFAVGFSAQGVGLKRKATRAAR